MSNREAKTTKRVLNGNILEFFTTETVEVKYFNITPKNKVKET